MTSKRESSRRGHLDETFLTETDEEGIAMEGFQSRNPLLSSADLRTTRDVASMKHSESI